jgi:hypothetical protein
MKYEWVSVVSWYDYNYLLYILNIFIIILRTLSNKSGP